MRWLNYQFGEGPKGPKASWDYTNETSKCDTGKLYFFAQTAPNGYLEKKIPLNRLEIIRSDPAI